METPCCLGRRVVGGRYWPQHRPFVVLPSWSNAHKESPMETETLIPQPGSPNGHTLAPVPPDTWTQIDQAYREIQRRDGSAEYRAWQWQRFALVLVALLLAMSGVVVWQLLAARKVQAVVQVVQ